MITQSTLFKLLFNVEDYQFVNTKLWNFTFEKILMNYLQLFYFIAWLE